MKRSCLYCGHRVIGRIDKKFCSDSCRNTFNNELNQDLNNLMRTTHNQLRKNYRILRHIHLNSTPKKKSLHLLINKDFNFDLFTSTYKNKQGKTYYFIYDIGYLKLDQTSFIVVQKKSYL